MRFDRFIGSARKRVRAALRKARTPHDFTELATETLTALELHRSIDPDALLKDVLVGGGVDVDFGAPEILPLHEDDDFAIHAHFWVDRIATPHTHNWVGAFQPLMGSSIYGEYVFDEHERIDADFRIGALRTRRMVMLGPGDVAAVRSGLALVHSIHHVDRPSVSLSIRRNAPDHALGTLDCWRPGVAVKTVWSHGSVDARRKTLAIIAATDPKRYDAALEAVLEHADLRTTFYLLDHGLQRHSRPERLARVAFAQRRRLGTAVETVYRAAQDRVRSRWFVRMRSRVRTLDERFFLGLMCDAPDRTTVFRLLQAHRPGRDPVAFLVRSARALAADPANGLPLGTASFAALESLLRAPASGPLRGVERAFQRLPLFAALFGPEKGRDEGRRSRSSRR